MPEMLDVLFADIEAARRRVLIECYIFASDEFGQEFAERLCKAVERGLDVRVLYDPLGSQKSEVEFFERMCARGIKVQPYRPAWPALMKGKLAPRDHARIFLADDVAWTGGAAWAKQWAPKDKGGEGWHDINIRIEGPVVTDFAKLFEQRWTEAPAKQAPEDYDTGDRYPDLRMCADVPNRDDSLVYDTYCKRICAARERIWMANAYFLPPPPMLRGLVEAAQRGVDVRILVPGESDLPIIRRASHSEYGGWIEAGLKIFEYQNVVMHSKYAVIDDDWCTVGTFNANSTSLGAANELNVFVFEPGFIAQCVAQLEKDLAQSILVTREMAASRPFLEQVGDQLASDAMAVVDMVVGPHDPR